jgi:hypothetical protein
MDGDQKNHSKLGKSGDLERQINVIEVAGKAGLEPKIMHFENAIQ